MTNTYHVHIIREMRLLYGGIVADSHEQAAAIARDKPTDQADSIDDCDGETSYSCVDVQGDEDYEQSRWIDFEPKRERIAARKLLAAVEAFLEADELAEECCEWKWENLAHVFLLAFDRSRERQPGAQRFARGHGICLHGKRLRHFFAHG